jgi:[ribosomal protein S5]-alanine N-acetyltransferase
MPTLETPRLLLRPMTAEDVPALLGIFSDPKVMATFDHPPFGQAEMERWTRRNLEHQTQYSYGLFSVILKSTGQLIGNCGLEVMEVEGIKAAELGYDFRSDYWNQGYATEAAIAVRDYAFSSLKLPYLISLMRQSNPASRRVAEKVGMRLEKELERYGVAYWEYRIDDSDLFHT